MQNYKKVALAYSGGLDTSVIIPWLTETYGCKVVAVAADLGQGSELDGLGEKAVKTGACACFIEDLRGEFVRDFIFPTLKMGAVYEGEYLLGTSFARPVIAKRVVEIALREGCDAIAHGCTGKGNDQVRFELTIKAFAPNMPVIAPWRVWDIKSREEELDYAQARGIPLPISRETNYSKDRNLWHLSHEGLDLEDPACAPDYEKILELCVTPEKAPDEGENISVGFEHGIPTKLNGRELDGVQLISELNKLGGKHAIGITDMVENRLVGMKSRGVYETPGGAILYKAHAMLEQLCLDRDTQHLKARLAGRFAELVYNGQWYTPLREALSAFADKTQENVTGEARLKLYKGNIIAQGMTSPRTLHDLELSSFGESSYNQADAEGFINLFGLPVKVGALLRG
ncbi:MAG: argininosuccinate synthase [Oscillospiraceae bacterium]|jgi:argininosuccinate synthase|nr:argininosuccinate synthase [Oscillospiraceae bacterium]